MEDVNILSPVLLGLGNCLFGLGPQILHIRANVRERHPRYASCIVLYSGGVLFGMVLMELLPDATRCFQRRNVDFPLAETVVCLGFFSLFLAQEGLRTFYLWRQRRFTDGSPGESTPLGASSSEYGSTGHSTMESTRRPLVSATAFSYPVYYAETFIPLSLAVHLFIGAMQIAVQATPHEAWMVFLSMAIVSYMCAFVIGALLYMSDLHVVLGVVATVFFNAAVTCGAVVGLATRTVPSSVVHGALDGLVGGGLLYLTFFGVLQRSRHVFVPGLAQFATTASGAATVGLFMFVLPKVP